MENDVYVLRPLPAAATRYRIDYRAELNPAQHDAATSLDGPLLVIAGAGSGKTRTLIYRVARLIESGADPGAILLLTFTRRAAAEMLRRAAGLIDDRCERVAGGTFHSFANLVLRRYGAHLDLASRFTILDRGDSEDVVHMLRAQMGLDRKEIRFPRKQTIMAMFSAAVNKTRPLADIIEDDYTHLLDHAEELLELQEKYRAYKRGRHLVDYDDLLVLLHELLRDHAEVRGKLAQRYRWVMVDEYQDTNRLQAEIVRLLAGEHGNVMVVGDDAQSIYAFRGADFRNIMDFPRQFPGCRVITLEQNYRSTQPILDVGNEIIQPARERYSKTLFTRATGGETPLLIAAYDDKYQSHFVAQRILELREEGVPFEEVAVLFRSAFHSFDLEVELTRCGIPFIKRGGLRFMEAAHIKDVLAHLRILANPGDAVSWHRVLQLLEGIGPRTAEAIIETVLTSTDLPADLAAFPGRGKTDLATLAGLLRRLQSPRLGPPEQLAEVVRYYRPILERVHRDDYPRRERDLEQFLAIASRYRTLEELLADMALEPPTDTIDSVLADEPDEGHVTLSTVHSAKGLEWHSVFVIWASEGRFPSYYSMDEEEQIEEERRLFYVAATRPKRNLYIIYPVNIIERGAGLVIANPSRFVSDIPGEVLRRVQLVEA